MATDSSGAKRSVLRDLPKDLPRNFLDEITDNFSKDRIIGSDDFGTAYEGIVKESSDDFGTAYEGIVKESSEMIAVERLSKDSPLSRNEAFENQVLNIMAVNHENIVKLVGYCHDSRKKLENNGKYYFADIVEYFICYEYLPTGSVYKNLFEKPGSMNWETRFKIIQGICQGLSFLHKIPIIHMDLKPQNILLDNNMVPKIAYFRLSRQLNQDQTPLVTPKVVASYGYMAPEYLATGEISTQCDIYSPGLTMIEITTGEKYMQDKNDPFARIFINKVREKWTAEYIVSNSIYTSLNADCLEQVKACIETGLECTTPELQNRPSIDRIVQKFNGS